MLSSPHSPPLLRRLLLLGGALLGGLNAGCDVGAVAKARALVESGLVDPGSAQYRDIKTYADGTVCGEVNAKNQMGGYVGFTRFAVHNGRLVQKSIYMIAVCNDRPDKLAFIKQVDRNFRTGADQAECLNAITREEVKADSAAGLRGMEAQLADQFNRRMDCTATDLYAK